MLILNMLEKLCRFFSSEVIKKLENIKKIRTSRPAYEKNAQRDVLGFMITQKCCITSERKKQGYSNFWIFQENLTFWKIFFPLITCLF